MINFTQRKRTLLKRLVIFCLAAISSFGYSARKRTAICAGKPNCGATECEIRFAEELKDFRRVRGEITFDIEKFQEYPEAIGRVRAKAQALYEMLINGELTEIKLLIRDSSGSWSDELAIQYIASGQIKVVIKEEVINRFANNLRLRDLLKEPQNTDGQVLAVEFEGQIYKNLPLATIFTNLFSHLSEPTRLSEESDHEGNYTMDYSTKRYATVVVKKRAKEEK